METHVQKKKCRLILVIMQCIFFCRCEPAKANGKRDVERNPARAKFKTALHHIHFTTRYYLITIACMQLHVLKVKDGTVNL